MNKDVHDLFPEIPAGTATVSYEDAKSLIADALIYGNSFIYPSGDNEPSHVRLSPNALLTVYRGEA